MNEKLGKRLPSTPQDEPEVEDQDDNYSTCSDSDDEELMDLNVLLQRTTVSPSQSKVTGKTELKRTALFTPVKAGLRKEKSKKARQLSFSDKVLVPGWTFSFDNLNRSIIPRSYSSTSQTTMRNMVSAMAIENRIPFETSTPLQLNRNMKKAVDIPVNLFLPSDSELDVIKAQHKELVKRILVKNIPAFESIKNSVQWHIDHQYSKISENKSRIVS